MSEKIHKFLLYKSNRSALLAPPFGAKRWIKMDKKIGQYIGQFFAGEVGIEPTLEDLESPVLPLYYSPLIKHPLYRGYFSLFIFLMQGMFFAEFAEFFQFQSFF